MTPADRARALFRSQVARLAARAGLDVVPSSIYSPVPWVPARHDPIWTREAAFTVDTGTQIEFAETELQPFLDELPEGLEQARDSGFSTWNGQYQAGDAEFLYALIRYLKPRRILELGSGFSTLVSAAACSVNSEEGCRSELTAVDPAPRTEITGSANISRVEQRDSRELPMARFTELARDDILFIDTSHIVKLGSEVNWLVLEVLPQLAPGVWVHFHDIFLPYEYPHLFFELGGFFNEQYLVQAFLTGNPAWEVKLAMCALYKRELPRLSALVPSLLQGPRNPVWADVTPAAFWICRR